MLVLTDNKIKELPDKICKLKKLESLLISKNQLTTLPKQIYLLKNLKTLIAIENNFSEAEKARIIAALPNCDVRF